MLDLPWKHGNICSNCTSRCKNRRVEIGNAREVYKQLYPSSIGLADENGKILPAEEIPY